MVRDAFGTSVPFHELEALAKASVIETFKPNQLLFKEGDPSDGLHLIRRGSVTISRNVRGKDQVVSYLPAGNIIGEMALLSPEAKRTAACTCSGPRASP